MVTGLDGRVAIVTGAGRGLGRAEALALVENGARVVVNDRGRSLDGSDTDGTPAEEVVAEIRASGGEAIAHGGDVADWDDAHDLVDTAVSTFGALDILVNNAGILRDRMIFSMTEDDFDAVIKVHLKGHFCTLRAATAYWRARAKGGAPVSASIINTSSEAFLIGSAGQPNYAAAKAGIVALTLATAQSCAKYGVRANAICPRARTRMTEAVFGDAPDGQTDPLDPGHVAPLVAYLASPAAAGINGQVFVVHGGLVALLAPPQLEERFDAGEDGWATAALADALGPYFADRDPGATFAANDLLRLRPVSV